VDIEKVWWQRVNDEVDTDGRQRQRQSDIVIFHGDKLFTLMECRPLQRLGCRGGEARRREGKGKGRAPPERAPSRAPARANTSTHKLMR